MSFISKAGYLRCFSMPFILVASKRIFFKKKSAIFSQCTTVFTDSHSALRQYYGHPAKRIFILKKSAIFSHCTTVFTDFLSALRQYYGHPAVVYYSILWNRSTISKHFNHYLMFKNLILHKNKSFTMQSSSRI